VGLAVRQQVTRAQLKVMLLLPRTAATSVVRPGRSSTVAPRAVADRSGSGGLGAAWGLCRSEEMSFTSLLALNSRGGERAAFPLREFGQGVGAYAQGSTRSCVRRRPAALLSAPCRIGTRALAMPVAPWERGSPRLVERRPQSVGRNTGAWAMPEAELLLGGTSGSHEGIDASFCPRTVNDSCHSPEPWGVLVHRDLHAHAIAGDKYTGLGDLHAEKPPS
jgi:hypothetical protein